MFSPLRRSASSTEKVPARSSSVDEVESLPPGDAAQITEWKVLAKIDYRVVPMLCLMYLLSFLDRVNIGNAALFGLKEDLHLVGNEYNNALVIFFIPYIVFEVPSNTLMKRFKPHVWLSGCMFLFGLTTCMQGLTQNYAGILAARFFLGVFENGMLPGGLYLLAMWYRREDALKRMALFYGSATLGGAFGGLLASAIGKMDGMRGFRGWRWVFILEGALTCVLSILLFFLISDFPEEVTWLTPEEKAFVKTRLEEDAGVSQRHEKITLRYALSVISDYKVIIGGFMYFGLNVPAYGYAYFSPTIIQQLGHSSIQSQLLSVPPWACTWVLAVSLAYFSDRIRHRFLFALVPLLIAIAGFVTLLRRDLQNTKVGYAALFLAVAGTVGALPVVLCWFTTNLAGHRRRAIAIGWQTTFGNIGGIIAAYAFLAKDAPRYTTGYALCIAFLCIAITSCTLYLLACIAENRKRDKHPSLGDSLSAEEKQLMGDLNPEYRYFL
ncbi:hypothetical protein EIP91_006725 [Steccherinum ochraceum]|uniref:Major facilitator superfamily (MFS) profile domain-containing protein n=1 Tax=Steccherinum ochraceum TaxID=92696 RepID=A0A4R0RB41_9APHY|nr:hypothetical protein EIP91_006725 [Steccherinum ochraceum]